MAISEQEAARALEEVKRARAKVERYDLPFAYHLLFGTLMGGLIAVHGLPLGWRLLGLVLLMALLGGMFRWLLARHGRWINGFRAGRTRLVALLMVATYLLLAGLSIPALHGDSPPLSPWAAGGIMFVVAVALDLAWMKALAADQKEGR